MTRDRHPVRPLLTGLLLIGALTLPGMASDVAADPKPPTPEATPAAPKPQVPPWLEPLRNRDGRVSWRAIAIGMQLREVASILATSLRTDLIMEVGCGGDALEIVVDGFRLLMAFEGPARDAKLHTLFVFVEPDLDANAAVAALKRHLPELRVDAAAVSRVHAGDDPRPTYRIGDPEVALMIDPRGLWLSDPMCVE